jgi:hypothetical protein
VERAARNSANASCICCAFVLGLSESISLFVSAYSCPWPTIHELSGKFRIRALWKTKLILDTGRPLSMTSEVMDSNFPLSDTADIENDR